MSIAMVQVAVLMLPCTVSKVEPGRSPIGDLFPDGVVCHRAAGSRSWHEARLSGLGLASNGRPIQSCSGRRRLAWLGQPPFPRLLLFHSALSSSYHPPSVNDIITTACPATSTRQRTTPFCRDQLGHSLTPSVSALYLCRFVHTPSLPRRHHEGERSYCGCCGQLWHGRGHPQAEARKGPAIGAAGELGCRRVF